MKCQLCEQEATVTYTKIVGDKSQKIHLCGLCSDDNGVTNIENFSLSDILMDNSALSNAAVANEVRSDACSNCGFTLDDLREIGRLGCSSCYVVFGAEVQSMIGKMHKGTTHKGKVPVRMLQVIQQKEQLEEVERDFKAAIKNEEFELAGELKLKLAELKKTLTLEKG